MGCHYQKQKKIYLKSKLKLIILTNISIVKMHKFLHKIKAHHVLLENW